MPTATPRTLDELRAITDPAERARAVQGYVDRGTKAMREAAEIRRQAVAELLESNDRHDWNRPSVVAQACGVSVSTVKAVRSTLSSKQ